MCIITPRHGAHGWKGEMPEFPSEQDKLKGADFFVVLIKQSSFFSQRL